MGSPQHYSTLLNNLAKASRLSSTTGVAWRTVATTPVKLAPVARKVAVDELGNVTWGGKAKLKPVVFNHAEAMKSATNKMVWWADLIHKC